MSLDPAAGYGISGGHLATSGAGSRAAEDGAGTSIPQRDEAASERVQRLVLLAVTLFRVGGIVQVLLVVIMVFASYRHPVLVALVVAGIMAESGILLTLCWRRRVLKQSWIFADVAVTATALLAGALLTASADYNTWANFAYPYSIVAQLIVGLGIPRLSVAIALSAAMASAYMTLTTVIHHDPVWNTLANALGYFANASVTWLVARELRVGGRRLDDGRRAAEEQAALLARERERARSARMLHDRALQTLEMLAGTDWIADQQVRKRVAVEAAWLRSFVKDGAGNRSPHLLEAFNEVIERHISAGLRILVNDAQLRASGGDAFLSQDGLSALTGAVDELLANVAKHAGVDEVTVRMAFAGGGVAASVVDGGRGFHPGQPTSGTGLRHSVRGRIEEAGGVVRLDSAPGQGASIEVWVPCQMWCDKPRFRSLIPRQRAPWRVVTRDARGRNTRRSSDGLGEVDRVAVRVEDVGHALAPGHVVRRAEDPAAQGPRRTPALPPGRGRSPPRRTAPCRRPAAGAGSGSR